MRLGFKLKDLEIARKIYVIIGIGVISLIAVSFMSYYLIRTLNTVTRIGMCEHRYALEVSRARSGFEEYVKTGDAAFMNAFDSSIDIAISYVRFFGRVEEYIDTRPIDELEEEAFKLYEELGSREYAFLMINRTRLLLLVDLKMIHDLIDLTKTAFPLGVAITTSVEKYEKAAGAERDKVYMEIRAKFDKMQKLGVEFGRIINEFTEYFQSLATMALFSVSLLAIAASLVFSIVISRSITKPLPELVHLSEKMSAGDFTQRIDVDRKDEIGVLADSMNRTVSSLAQMFKDIADGVDTLTSSSVDLTDISRRMSQSAEQSSDKSDEVAAAAKEMSATMNSVAGASEIAASNINMVAAAAEEMASTIHEIARNSENARSITDDAVSKAGSASDKVEELGGAAREINKVTETITSISDQTNLLALNATIEAARAGKAGKGFTVVANEIKELAGQTSHATRDIKKRIEGIQNSTAGTVTEIEQISSVINKVNELISTIAIAVDEQTAATGEVAENVARASEGIQEVNENVGQSSAVADEITKDILEVNQAAGEISSSGSKVNMSAEELSGLAGKLKEMVGKFKI